MTDIDIDKLRYDLTCKAKEIVRSKYTRKDTIKEKEKAVTELVRDKEFLLYMQTLIGKNLPIIPAQISNSKVVHNLTVHNTPAQTVNTVERIVPVATIDYASYMPYKWGTEYVEIDSEATELEHNIMNSSYPYIIESEKGMGKTLLVTDIAIKHNLPLITLSCSSGTKISDLEGRTHIDEKGSYFQLGVIPIAIEMANKFKHSILFLDEVNALEPALLKRLNPVLDERHNIYVNGRLYRLDDGCKLSIVCAMNPVTYSGVNNLTEDMKSRCIGVVWNHSVEKQLNNTIDWTNISDEMKKGINILSENMRSLRAGGQISYNLSIRDVKQMVDSYRMFINIKKEHDYALTRMFHTCIINHKLDSVDERGVVSKLIYDIFGVTV